MAKRVSVKGKGADIFFGEYPVSPPPHEPVSQTLLDDSTLLPAQNFPPAHPTEKHASTPARLQESKHASMQDLPEIEEEVGSPLGRDVLSAIADHMAQRATVTNAFRYTDQELQELTDALYEITKRHRVKLTKQDVARLGLNAVLWDYQMRGDASLLGEFVLRRKQPADQTP
jgi:hypothetical protein